MSRRFDALYQIREIVRQGNWVAFDAETTRLWGQVVSFAVVAPDGAILGESFIKPAEPISPDAQAIHGITDADLENAPTFDVVWPQLARLFEGKAAVVSYNAPFDAGCLTASASPYFCFLREDFLPWVCAMRLFAAFWGEWSDYWGDYRWQTLSTACMVMGIEQTKTHHATADAQATAQLMQKLAERADQELPPDYHLPLAVPCSGGCGETQTHAYEDEGDGAWWCDRCAVQAGLYHICPRCQEKWAIVRNATADALCQRCDQEVKLAQGIYHLCGGCGKIVKASVEAQKYHDKCCQRRAYRRKRQEADWSLPEGATPVHAGPHEFEAIHSGKMRVRCKVCNQQWRTYPRSRCPGIVTYQNWSEVPAGYVTWTELQKRKLVASRSLPAAAVRISQAPYYLYLFDSGQATPRVLSPARQAAIERMQAAKQERYTCWLCRTYQQRRYQQDQFHEALQMCHSCYEGIELWNKQIEWAQARLAQNALVCQATYHNPPGLAKGTLRDVLLLRLDDAVVYQAEEFDASVFFPLLLQNHAVVGPNLWDHLYYVCPSQELYPYWKAERSGIAGSLPVVREPGGRFVNLAFGSESIYGRWDTPNPITTLCHRWGLALDPDVSTAEKMRQLIIHVAAREPLERHGPPSTQAEAYHQIA